MQTAVVGESAALREVTLSGGTGRLDLSVKVMFDGEEIAVENNAFIPTKAGTYTVEYTVTDYIGRTAVASYEIRAEVGDDPFIYGSVSLPRYFIAGKTYKLPQLAFTDYASGAAEVKNASVSVNGAAAADNTYTAAGSTITDDVPAGALGIARARQVNKPQWAKGKLEKFIAKQQAKEEAGSK